MSEILFAATCFGALLYASPAASGWRGYLVFLGLALLTISTVFVQAPTLAG